MSLLIENTEELLTVVKKLNLKVASVDELRHLLAEINANYNPEAARQKTGKLVGVAVPMPWRQQRGSPRSSFWQRGTRDDVLSCRWSGVDLECLRRGERGGRPCQRHHDQRSWR